MANDLVVPDTKVKKERSPSFPFISLRRAVARAQQFAESHKRSATRLVSAAPTWNYGERSSGLLQTVAALKQYGLIEDSGSGEERRIQITELAWRILMDTRPGAKETALKEAAIRPRLIAEYASSWLPERPSDSHCLSELRLDRGFTEESAKTFLKVFDETTVYAGLKPSDISVPTSLEEVFDNPRTEISITRPSVSSPAGVGTNESAPPPPSNKGELSSEFKISFSKNHVTVTGTFVDSDSVKQAIKALTFAEQLLPPADKSDKAKASSSSKNVFD